MDLNLTISDILPRKGIVISNYKSVNDKKDAESAAKDARKELHETWQKAYETLKKRYPPATAAPTDPNAAKQDKGTLYRGQAANYWIEQRKDVDPKMRKEALDALGSLVKTDKGLIPYLITHWEITKKDQTRLAL